MDKPDLNRLHCDPKNWRLFFFYFCRNDPRLIVPKRIGGMGWTFNFARPLAVPFFLLLLGCVVGVLALSKNFLINCDARFAVKIGCALALVFFCYKLSKPRLAEQK